ncbi:MAG: M28 family peptidase [Bacteroidetes bacterium]|nr:M28 family peptidase [Bacteroidota bacterium]
MNFRTIWLTLILSSCFILPGYTQSPSRTGVKAFPSRLKKPDKVTLSNLERHIHYLADSSLEGRRAGSPGEAAASGYISSEFARSGLRPGGDNGRWLQAFTIDDGRSIDSSTTFSVNDRPLVIGREFFPLAISAAGAVTGAPAIALQESGVPWFLDLRELIQVHGHSPHFDLENAIRAMAGVFAGKGATALIVYNSSKTPDNLSFDPRDRPAEAPIPVIYMTMAAKRKYLKDESASVDLKIKVAFAEKQRTAHNVLGMLDNGAPLTIVIGAHYDHLGHGEDSNTLYRGPGHPVFNGADDNASGVAGMIELARLLSASKLKANNYLFIAFSGEELGLFGSKYFVGHPTIDLKSVNYMVNLDMIGRLNDTTHALTVGGYGTSPAWAGAFKAGAGTAHLFSFRFDSSGLGPSDHTSFYRKDIPVLFFFTGIHSDYHKPGDSYEKINYTGELQVLKLVWSVVEELDKKGRLAFTRTRDASAQGIARFSVTLGILPDYSFSGSGVRADAVSEGRPAQAAGMRAGDVIVQLGEFPVTSLQNYMEALGKFKKGDKTTVKYRGGDESIERPVQF